MHHTMNILRDIHLEAKTAYGLIEPEDPLAVSLMFIINMSSDELDRLESCEHDFTDGGA